MPQGKATTALKPLSQARSWDARSLLAFSRGSSPCAGLSNGMGGLFTHSLSDGTAHTLLWPRTHL